MHAVLQMAEAMPPASPGAGDHAALLGRIAEDRDREAFAALFDHFAPRLKGFFMKKGTAPEAAEDLVQDAMLAVWNKAALYDSGRGGVAAWIYTIARNLRIDRARRGGGRVFQDIDDYDAASDEPDAETLTMRAQSAEAVGEALKALPPEQLEVIELSFVESLAHSEIADRLGLPLGTVKSRVRLAYRRLKTVLEGRI